MSVTSVRSVPPSGTNITECTEGHYCVAGEQIDCPSGTFNAAVSTEDFKTCITYNFKWQKLSQDEIWSISRVQILSGDTFI